MRVEAAGTGRALVVAMLALASLMTTMMVTGSPADGQSLEARRLASPAAPPPPAPGPLPPAPEVCDGVPAMSATEARGLALTAAAALDVPLTVAVVDRVGRVQALLRQPGADPALDDRAVGMARTGAFFSNDQAPLSSRTVRFVSGIHFPPGIERTPNAALYGIENTNRGCDLAVPFDPGQAVPPARSINGLPCDPFDPRGCGTGPVTGKVDAFDSDQSAVDPGGLPVFRGSRVVGGIGVVAAEATGARASGATEFAALAAFDAPAAAAGGLAPLPQPLPPPGVVFIDGIRLPFVRQVTRPTPFAPGNSAGTFVVTPGAGGCAPDGFLVSPQAGVFLTRADVESIVQQAVDTAERTRAVIRLSGGPVAARARMVIAVGDVDGSILALFRMPDATVFSIDVAVAKARNVMWLSSPAGKVDLPGVPADTAITNRTVNFTSQPLFPAGIDGSGPGPFFRNLFVFDRQNPCSQGSQPTHARQNGIVFFAGSIPLYQGRNLVGGLGISGDGVEQDDYVAFFGAEGFQPPEDLWADQVFLRGVRLPFLKFPRNPED